MIDHFHAVRFYDNEVALCRVVAGFLREGLALGQPCLLVGTTAHNNGIFAELRARELPVDALRRSDELVMVDAAEVMEEFMIDGTPDADRFAETATRVFERIRHGRKDVTIRAYGETVDVLWRGGRDVAAIELETLWNKLARANDFSLLCGHALGSFYTDTGVRDVCRLHTHVVGPDGVATVSNVDTLLMGSFPDLSH